MYKTLAAVKYRGEWPWRRQVGNARWGI